jgi:hypothetical protein
VTAARRASPLRARRARLRVALAAAAVIAAVAAAAPGPAAAPPPPPAARGECTTDGRRCLYRSMLPSAGIIADCRSETDCRVGYYYGDPDAATWFAPPPGMTALPRPVVIWRTANLAETRVECGRACAWSYFFEARRRRVSPPRRTVLEVDPSRLLLAAAEDPALVIRQVFSGREVARIERDWAPGGVWGAVTALRFDRDGRLSLTWLQGASRAPVTERVSVSSVPRG